MQNPEPKREMLRHTIATLAYRGAKAIRDAPDSFASFRASETTRTHAQILAHVGDLLDLLADWVPDEGRRNAILASNARKLYGFDAVS